MIFLEYQVSSGNLNCFPLRMAGQTMLLMGNAAEIDGNIGDDAGMARGARMMQLPIFSPALVGRDQYQAQSEKSCHKEESVDP